MAPMPTRNSVIAEIDTRKVRQPQQREVEQRRRMAARVQPVAQRAGEADADHRLGERRRAPRRARRSPARTSGRTARGRRAPGRSQSNPPRAASRDVLDEQRVTRTMPTQADRHVDVEDPAPGEVGDDEAADRRADHRADQRRRGQPGHRRHQLVLGTVRSSTSRPTGTIIAPPMPCRMRASTRSAERVGLAARRPSPG